MPSKRLNIEQFILNSRPKQLKIWLQKLEELKQNHGLDMVLYTVNPETDVNFFITNKEDVFLNIEQNYISANCSMTLKQWIEAIKILISKFGETSFLYLDRENSTMFFLSPMED
jgi:hypothetical protein